MIEQSDAALVAAARGGDREAFGRLLVRHRPLLVALCARALGDRQAAEDAAQEAALQAMLGLDRLRQPERFGSWLAGIGLNICRRSRRARALDAWSWEALQGGTSQPEPVDPGPDPAARAEAADLAEGVRRAVAGLPPGQRAAVGLVYLSGLTHAEAAALLGIEPGAVKTRLHKARQSLRRRLWAIWEDQAMTTTEIGAVEVRVADVRRRALPVGERDPVGEHAHCVVLLEEVDGARRLPIWVGEFEGTAIALHLEKAELPRPLTYAFAAAVLAAVGGRVREARIARLEGDVFYAVVAVEGARGASEVDARPSDAINLALLTGAPIRVEPAVFVAATSDDPTRDKLAGDGTEGAAAIAAAFMSDRPGQRPAEPAEEA